MPPHDHQFVLRRIREDVSAALSDVRSAVDPEQFGRSVCQKQEARDKLASYGLALLEAAYVEEARKQTRGRPVDAEQVEAWPLDTWISAANPGQRIRYRHAKWEDHTAHREHQILNVRRVNKAFDAEEERRSRLRTAGMASDPDMTTEQAVARLDSTDIAAD